MARNTTIPENAPANGLMGAEDVLKALFPSDATRPSLRWMRRLQAKRLVPYRRVGRLIFFDPEEVRTAIDRNFRVNAIGE